MKRRSRIAHMEGSYHIAAPLSEGAQECTTNSRTDLNVVEFTDGDFLRRNLAISRHRSFVREHHAVCM